MAVEDSVAQDQLRAFIERIERMEEEKAGITSDIKEIYAEAKGNGFDTKILRKIVAIRKQDANERMEQEAVLDLYMGALGMVAAPPDEDDDYTPKFGSNVSREPATLDDLVEQLADHVDPKMLMNIIEGSKTEAGRKIIMGALAAVNGGDVVSTAHIENIEPHPTKADGSDLTEVPPANNSGQVADIPDVEMPISTDKPEASDFTSSDPQRSVVATREDASSDVSGDEQQNSAASAKVDAQEGAADLQSSEPAAPEYPFPGDVYWENTPRRPVKRHEYSAAFGTLGQDIHVITEDIAKAQSAAIVMMGDTILDGWARYNVARGMVGMNGQTTDYPAYQYDGTDPLMDCIRWNLEGRILDLNQRQIIAKRLIEKEPKRKADIIKAFGFAMEAAA